MRYRQLVKITLDKYISMKLKGSAQILHLCLAWSINESTINLGLILET